MIGIDITRISRFQNKSEKFCERILHPQEMLDFIKSNNKAKYLATHWVLKEAIYKANNNFVNFNQIKCEKENGRYKFNNFELSSSTEDDFVTAIAFFKGE